MRHLVRFCLILAALPALAEAQSKPLEGFDAYVSKAVKDWHAPGLAIAVVHDDSVVFIKGYGTRTVGKNEPVDEHTRFACASTTKAMTAMLMAMLVDSGKVQWDEHVIDALPEFQVDDPYFTREVTIRDLLTHRAGLGNIDQLWYASNNDLPTIIHKLRFVKPAYPMRSSFIYQNVMYATAGAIESRVTSMPWDTLVRRRLWTPLGMNETNSSTKSLVGLPNVATPHVMLDDNVRAIEWRNLDNINAAGSANSSISDMAKWVRFVLDSARLGGKRMVSAASYAELFKAQTLLPREQFYPTDNETHPNFEAYGFGWFLQDYRGHKVAFHTGSIDGMSAIVGLLPDKRTGVVVLVNLDHAELRHALMWKVIDAYLGDQGKDWSADLLKLYGERRKQGAAGEAAFLKTRVAGTKPALPLAKYAGTYADSLNGDVRVEQSGTKLIAHYGQLQGEMEPWSADTFLVTWRDIAAGRDLFTFVMDAGNQVAEVRTGTGTFRKR
jgi:CubicO group peptidase (beta-lactamase class C family)